MKDKTRLKFKDGLKEIDYLKILIEQNQTLIQFAAMQQNNLINGALNTAVISMYNDAIDDYIDKTPPPPPAEVIPEEKKAMIENLKRRKEEGEDISKIANDLGLSKYLN